MDSDQREKGRSLGVQTHMKRRCKQVRPVEKGMVRSTFVKRGLGRRKEERLKEGFTGELYRSIFFKKVTKEKIRTLLRTG